MIADELRDLVLGHEVDRGQRPRDVGGFVVDGRLGRELLAVRQCDGDFRAARGHLIRGGPEAAELPALHDRLHRGKLHVLSGYQNLPSRDPAASMAWKTPSDMPS